MPETAAQDVVGAHWEACVHRCGFPWGTVLGPGKKCRSGRR